MSIYSRPAFVAEKALAALGIMVSKNHIREIVASICGFSSLAALQASPHFPGGVPVEGLLVFIDRARALKRCQELAPKVAPQRVLEALIHAVDTNLIVGAAVLEHPDQISTSLRRLAQVIAMKTPEMAGTVDDYEARVRARLDPDPTSLWPPMDEALARTLEKDNGPVRCLSGSVAREGDTVHLLLQGNYTASNSECGLVNVDLLFRALGPSRFLMDSKRVTFLPGEDNFFVTAADMDFQFPQGD